MELLEVLITLPLRKNSNVPAGATTETFPPNMIAEPNETLLLPLERLRLLEQSMIMMRLQL
jgi:hypothetical protein